MAELGIDYDAFRRLNPRLVMCSITPFGLTGPHKDYKAYELTLAHGGGWGWLGPGASDRPDLPPLKAAGHQADFQGGLAAATATLAAYYRALQTGEGEHVDLSVQAYIASFLEQNLGGCEVAESSCENPRAIQGPCAMRVASRSGR